MGKRKSSRTNNDDFFDFDLEQQQQQQQQTTREMSKITQAKAVWKQHDYKAAAENDVQQWSTNAKLGGRGGRFRQDLGTYLWWNSLTIHEGERVLVTNTNGASTICDGPRRITLCNSYYRYVTRYSAGPTQYLAIEYQDGTKENVRGPVTLWEDSKRHATITILPCITLNASEAMVIYERLSHAEKTGDGVEEPSYSSSSYRGDTDESERRTLLPSIPPLSASLSTSSSLSSPSTHRMVASAGITRKIQWGPCLYVPTPQEWVHMFQWGGAGSQVGGQGFSKVNTTPDSLEVQVDFVRTADDGMLDLSLMIYFELLDVEKMLDATQDPITDITNALTSDVILTFSKTTFQKFKLSTEILNDIRTYGETLALASRIGYKIHRVVFKGYRAGAALQTVQDNAIRSRTKLMLEEETERQNQTLHDMKLQKEQERAAKKQELETEQIRSEIQLKRLKVEHEVSTLTEKHNVEIEHLKQLANLEIDLTAYLVAKEQKLNRANSDHPNPKPT